MVKNDSIVCFPKEWVDKIMEDINKGEQESKLNKELINVVDDKNKTIEVQDSLISALFHKVSSQKGIIEDNGRDDKMNRAIIKSLIIKNKKLKMQRNSFIASTALAVLGFIIFK